MSSQQYKDKLQQFQLENAEIKNATMEAENTSIRIAQHYRTLLELLRLLGIQEILEAGDTTTTGTVAKLLGGVSIADVFKVSSDIGLTDPEDPPQQVLTRLANGDIKLKPIEEFAAGSGSGIQNLPTVANQNFFETANSGVYYASDNDVFSDLNFNGFVKVSEWEYNLRTIEVTGWFDNYGIFMSKYYNLIDNQDTTFTLNYIGDALTLNNFLPTSIQEQNNQDILSFWKGTQAEYDAITTKSSTTLYIDSNSGLIGSGITPTVTASVITNYDIDVATQTEHWNLTMTGDTDFDFANMFASGNSKVITITLEGDYAFTLPSWLKPLETNDDYDTISGTLVAEIVINIKNGGVSPSGYYSLQMIDYAL